MHSSRHVAVRSGCTFYLHFPERGCTLRLCVQMWGPPAIMVSASAGLLKCLSAWLPPVCGVTLLDVTEEAGLLFWGHLYVPCKLSRVICTGWSRRSYDNIAREVILGLLERRQSCCFAHCKSFCWSWVMVVYNNHTAPESWSLFLLWANQTRFAGSIFCITFFSCQ